MDFASWSKEKQKSNKKTSNTQKKQDDNYGAVAPIRDIPDSPMFVYNSYTKTSNPSQNNSFSTWTAASRAQSSPQTWAKESAKLVNDIGNYYSQWRNQDEQTAKTKAFTDQLNEFINASKNYSGSFGGGNVFTNMQNALYDASNYAKQSSKIYSQFGSQQEYDRAVKANEWYEKYKGYTYAQKKNAIAQMKKNNPSQTAEERQWLEANIQDGMTAKDYDEYIKDKQKELEDYRKTWTGRSEAALADPEGAANEWYKKKSEIDAEISKAKSRRYLLQKNEEYESVRNAADFGVLSQQKPARDIRNLISTSGHLVQGEYVEDVKPEGDWKPEDWTQEEVDTATYLWNKDPEKAKAYWNDYLKYVVLERAAQRKQQEYSEYATKNLGTGILSSALSVGGTLMSGTGLTSALGQNIRNKLAGEEGYRPINYYGDAWDATRYTSAVRGAISQSLNDRGTIQLDEKQHPFLAKFLNGKGLGDLYQMGMSMADSAALAAVTVGLSPALGEAAKYTTVLLGGSAGSQGILDALERGGSDEQALMMGVLNGTFEALFEEVSLDHLIHPDKNFIINLLKQGLIEGSEEVSTSFFNNIADIAVMASNSDYMQKAQQYMDQGMTEDEAMRQALLSTAKDIAWDFIGGAVSGGLMGMAGSARVNIMRNASYANEARQYNAQDVISDLQAVSPDSKLAGRMQARLDEGQDISNWSKGKMLQQTEEAVLQRDADNVREAVTNRLTELGETQDVQKVANAIVDIVTAHQLGEDVSRSAARVIENSTYGNRVLNELNADNAGDYSTEWTKNIRTEILGSANRDVFRFRRAVDNFIRQNEQQLTDEGYTIVRDESGRAVGLEASREEFEQADINELSRKYTNQAQTMIDTYEEGQNVEDYDRAFGDVYEMGRSGLTLESATQAMEGSILSESQIKAAYQAGREASDMRAASIANENRGKAMQVKKRGWRRGSLSADGVTMADLDSALNDIATERGENVRDFVRKSIDLIRTISEATGIDVVLYQSSADEDGKFRGAQGRYEWKDSKIYVDINAGLMNISDATDIGKYIMLQTFTHEFVHFMEQWSPAEYNELRDLVMEQIAKSEDVDALIRDKQRRLGGDISYDEASREVVADGLSRLLPQSSFVENLAAEHQNVFQRLLERLKQFLADIKEHFAQLGKTNQREIGYLTEDVDGTIQYVQDIVDLFDYVAQNAVENYQETLEGFPEAEMVQATETKAANNTAVEATKEQEETIAKKPKKRASDETIIKRVQAETDPVLLLKYYVAGEKAGDVRGPAAKQKIFELFDQMNRKKNIPAAIKNGLQEGRRTPANPASRELSKADKVTNTQRQSMAQKVAVGPVVGNDGVYWVTDGYHLFFVSEEAAKAYAEAIKTGAASTRTLLENMNVGTTIQDAIKAFENAKLLTTKPVEYFTKKGNKIMIFENEGTYSAFNPKFVKSLDGGAFYFAAFGRWQQPSLFATNKAGDLVGFALPITLNDKDGIGDALPELFALASEYDNREAQMSDREQAFSDLSFEETEQYIEAGLPVAPEAEVEWSIRTNEEQMDNTEKYVSNNGKRIPKSTLDAVRALRTEVAAYLEKYASKLNLPNEVIGNPFVKNGSYDISYDPTTVCVRSLGVLRLQQLVSERLGRPLTARENFEIAQEAFEWTDNPQCLYCFAALDRMAKSEYLMDFVNRQNRAVKALNDGAKKSDAYQAFLPDGHKGSTHMRKVFNGIYDRWKNKGRLLTLKDVATYDKLNELVNRDEAGGIGELAYWANQYAQNASWAKAQRQYQAYNGNILKWSEDMIKTLNSHYGLRLNSHSEFSPAFILEYLQIYTDAAARGLKALEYTSDINAAKIFAPTGAAINMSISIVGDSYDNMGMDAMQGCDWTEARAVRDKYPNAGIVAVALNDEQTRWALDQDWIDVVIPMHLVKTGDEIAKYMNWTNTKAISDDKKQKGKWDKDRDESHIYPSLHLNDKETYLRQLKANHLTPRFEKWLDHPGYMKLVNETRQATTEMKPLQPVFDEDALWSAIHMMEARGGYFERLGHTEEGEEYIAEELTERFKNGPRYFEGNPRGKVAADVLGDKVKYSRRIEDINTDYMAAVESGDEAEQQKYVDEAAMAAGAISENGKPVQLYHGTPRFGFTWFDTDKLDDNLSIFLTDNPKVASTYSGSTGIKRIFEKDIKHDVNNMSDEEIAARMNKIYGKEEVIAVSSKQLESIIDESLTTIHQRAEKSQSVLENEDELNAFKERHAFDIEHIPDIGVLSEDYLRTVASLKESDDLNEITSVRRKCTDILRKIRHYYSGGSDFDLTNDLENLAGMTPSYLLAVEKQLENRGNDVFTLSGYKLRIYSHDEMEEQLRYMLQQESGRGNYAIYAFAPALLTIDATDQNWNDISWMPEEINEEKRKQDEARSKVDALSDKGVTGTEFDAAWAEYERLRDEYDDDISQLQGMYGFFDGWNTGSSTRAIAAWASDHGYDGVKFEGLHDSGGEAEGDYPSNVYVIFSPEDTKSSDPITYDDDGNVIPLTERFNLERNELRYSRRELDDQYMQAVNSGDMDTAQRMVDEAAKKAGYITAAYHGTGSNFTEFNPDKIGANYDGYSLFGKGFYFTDSKDVAKEWGRRRKVLNVYLDIKNPFTDDVIKSGPLLDEYNKARKAIDKRLKPEDEEATSFAFATINEKDKGRSTEILKQMGYDGIIHRFADMQGSFKAGTTEYVVFSPEQIKSADPVTYDDNGNVIPLSQRFDTTKNDIRYSQRELDDQYMSAVESGDMDTAQRMVDERAIASGAMTLLNGARKPYYHGSSAHFTIFDINKAKEGTYGYGFYFSPMKSKAGDYGDVRSFYLMTNRIATMDNNSITAEQVQKIFDEYNIPFDDTIGRYVDSVDEWVNRHNDKDIVLELERFIHMYTAVEPADFLQRFRQVFGYDGVRQTNETVLWDNRLAKSADPVTYDDKGNVIPLSQRFNTEEQDIRYQQRTEAITDSELLQMASEDLALEQLTDGEREALNTFNKKLTELQKLQEQRTELGRQYREQQFEKGGDRKAAAQTLERMKILDGKIERAQNGLLSIKDKQVLKRVLQQARKNLESIDRQKARELVRRYRDRRDNAEAVRKYRKRINKDASEIAKWIIKPNGKDAMKNVPAVIREPIIKILQGIDRSSKRMLSGGPPTKADLAYINEMKKLQEALSTRVNSNELYSGYTDLPEDFMDNLNKIVSTMEDVSKTFEESFVLNQMTADELKRLADFVTILKSMIHKATNSLIVKGNIVQDADADIEEFSKMKPLETKGAEKFFMYQTMRPIDVFDRFGNGGKKIFKALMAGQNQMAFDTKEIIAKAEEIYTAKEAKEWSKKLVTVTLGGAKVQMPVTYAMGLYELSKRKNAEGHLYGNGVRVATFQNGRQKITDEGHRVTRAEIKALENILSPRQKEVADKLQNYMAEQGAKWGNYVSVARFGIEQFTEMDYYPIASDGRFLTASADERPALASLYALLNMSFTKDLKDNANNRAMVYDIFDVFSNHMSAMAQYHSFALPVLDSLKWLNYEQVMEDEDGGRIVTGSVREQLARVFGGDVEGSRSANGYAQTFITNLLKAINGTDAQGDTFDTLGMKMLHHYNVAQIAFNVRVVLQQPMAITRAGMVMSYASITKALSRPDLIAKNIAEMQEKNGIAAWKSLGFYDVNVSRSMADLIKHSETAIDKVNAVGLWGAETADKITWAIMWQAAKNEAQAKRHVSPSDSGYWDAVNEIFDETIYRTQVVDSVLTKNEYLRSKGFFARATGSFMNEPMTTYSTLARAYDKFRMDMANGSTRAEAWKKNAKNIGRTAAVYAISAILLSVVQSVADAWRDDDQYETYGEKWWESFTGNIIDEMAPFNNLPIFSDVWNVGKQIASIFGADTYGNNPRQLYMEFTKDMYSFLQIVHDKITDPDNTNYTWYAAIYKLLRTAAGMTGLPFGAATREVINAWNNTVGQYAPSLLIKDYDAGAKSEIKFAFSDGYLTREEALAALTDPEVMGDDVMDANDAYWLVNGWEGESTSKYSRMYTALLENPDDYKDALKELTDHGVKEKDAVSQAKSQIGKWYRGEEETTITRAEAKKLLVKIGMKEAKADELLTEWTMKKDTGIAYGDELKEAYLDGTVSYSDAVKYRVKYGSEDEADADEAVTKWKYEKETGIAYSDMKEAFMDGKITYAEAVRDRVQYGGVSSDTATGTVDDWKGEKISGYAKDNVDDAYMKGSITKTQAYNAYLAHGYEEEAAQKKVDLLEFKKQYPQAGDITYSAMAAYKEYCQADGVDVNVFFDVYTYNGKTSADVDANGNSINGSKRVKVLAYIDSLNISNFDKDSLYFACGYAKSTLKNAPWHKR